MKATHGVTPGLDGREVRGGLVKPFAQVVVPGLLLARLGIKPESTNERGAEVADDERRNRRVARGVNGSGDGPLLYLHGGSRAEVEVCDVEVEVVVHNVDLAAPPRLDDAMKNVASMSKKVVPEKKKNPSSNMRCMRRPEDGPAREITNGAPVLRFSAMDSLKWYNVDLVLKTLKRLSIVGQLGLRVGGDDEPATGTPRGNP